MASLEYKNLLVEVREEWSQFFHACNWYTFRFCMLEFENDETLGSVEVTIIILGLSLRMCWRHTETETLRSIKDQIASLTGQE